MPRSLRPLAKARARFAEALDSTLNDHWVNGEEAYSNVAIARMCGVDEKTVRAWREDESDEPGVQGKPMPAAALQLVPSRLHEELLEHVAAARGRAPKRAIGLLRRALVDIEWQIANEDPREVVKALAAAQVQLGELMKKAMGGGR